MKELPNNKQNNVLQILTNTVVNIKVKFNHKTKYEREIYFTYDTSFILMHLIFYFHFQDNE